jgi:phosphohistidine swiveling domain-containing protein/acyl carrier protein
MERPDVKGSIPGPAAGTGEAPTAVLRGLGAAPGRARGPAHVVGGKLDLRAVPAGSILVARLVNPSLAPVFFLVAGVVLEEGGLLQHATALAREFGIPAIVGIPGATDVLRDGEPLEVRGDSGEVVRLAIEALPASRFPAPERVAMVLAPMDEDARTLGRCLRQNLPLIPPEGDIDLSVELFEFGLDSMSAIFLLLDVEEAFSIHFPEEMLDPKTFLTGESLLAAIHDLRARGSSSTPC